MADKGMTGHRGEVKRGDALCIALAARRAAPHLLRERFALLLLHPPLWQRDEGAKEGRRARAAAKGLCRG